MQKVTSTLIILLFAVLSIALVPPVFSSTDESSEQDSGSDQDEDTEEQQQEEERSEPETEPEPEPEQQQPPIQTDEPPAPATETPGGTVAPEVLPPEPQVIDCQEGFILNEANECVASETATGLPPLPPECEGMTPLECLGEKIGAPPPECDNLTPLECLDLLTKPTPPPPVSNLPLCDGTPQDCITENGDICLEGQGSHECECAEDMSDCPLHPSLKPLPYCDTPRGDAAPACHDRKDIDELTGLYPCNDGTQEEDWRDCEDASLPNQPSPSPDEQCQALGCPGSLPDPVRGCDDGRDPENGICPIPEPLPPCHPDTDEVSVNAECEAPEDQPGKNYDPRLPDVDDLDCSDIEGTVKLIGTKDPYRLDGDGDGIGCEPFENGNGGGGNDDEDINVTINRIVKIVKDNNYNHGHDNFPEIDIIGLSTKADGNSMLCLMNIDDSHIQCQEFGMSPERVNSEFWRIIETDHDKDYDNGNTGSNDVDLAIEDIKNQDFDELDDDRDNHDFGIDLAWIAINPQGDGVACLAQDSTGKGKSLCEPFKVSAEDVDGQITEGVAFSS